MHTPRKNKPFRLVRGGDCPILIALSRLCALFTFGCACYNRHLICIDQGAQVLLWTSHLHRSRSQGAPLSPRGDYDLGFGDSNQSTFRAFTARLEAAYDRCRLWASPQWARVALPPPLPPDPMRLQPTTVAPRALAGDQFPDPILGRAH